MWFKNIQLYLLKEPFTLAAEQLEEALQARPARECGPLEMQSLGWSAPLGVQGAPLAHAANGCLMISSKRVEKIMPAAVIREELERKVEEIETEQGRKLRRQQKQEMKEEIVHDLLPRAFTRSIRTFAYIDPANGWIIADTSSPKRAEELISLLRETLGSIPTKPLQVAQSPSAIMTAWLTGTTPGAGLNIGDECELRDPAEEGGIVRCRRQDLGSDEIKPHLEAGKQAVRLALNWQDRLEFLLGEDMAIRRLKFLDLVLDEAEAMSADDAAARFDADFTLMSMELAKFLPELLGEFGGIPTE